MKDAEYEDDAEIPERGIPSVGRQNNSSKLIPAATMIGVAMIGLYVVFGSQLEQDTAASIIPASASTDFSTGVANPPQISAFEELRRRLFNQDGNAPTAQPSPPIEGETRTERAMRLAREKQALELERDRQTALLKAQAQKLAFEQKRLEAQFRLQQAELEDLKQRERAKTLVFDASRDKESNR